MKRKKLLTKFLAVGLAVSFAMSSATGVYATEESSADTEVSVGDETGTPDETLPTETTVVDPAAVDIPAAQATVDPSFLVDPSIGRVLNDPTSVDENAQYALPGVEVLDSAYEFVGWSNKAGEVKSAGVMVDALSGDWTAVFQLKQTETKPVEEKKITFVVPEGQGKAVDPYVVKEGVTTFLLPGAEALEGYDFVGWVPTDVGTDAPLKAGTEVPLWFDSWTAVFKAVETEPVEEKKITFVVPEEQGKAVDPYVVKEGAETFLLPEAEALEGYDFVGWVPTDVGTDAPLKAGTEVPLWFDSWTAVFKAVETEPVEEKKITFVVPEEQGKAVDPYVVKEGAETFLLPEAEALEGYDFVGWVPTDVGTDAPLKAGTEVPLWFDSWTAVFKTVETEPEESKTIKFIVPENQGEPVEPYVVKPDVSMFYLPEVTPLEGYEFVEWVPNGMTTDNTFVEGSLAPVFVDSWTAVFKAVSTTAKEVEVIFHVDEKKGEPVGSITVPNGTIFEVTAPVAKNGWKFVGWKVEGMDMLIEEGATVEIAPGLNEFTAVFEESDEITVIFHVDEKKGEPVGSITVPKGTVFEATAPVAKNGWKFVGWKVEGMDMLIEEGATVEIAPGLNEFTAVFEEADEITVIFHVDEKKGEPVGSITVPKGTVFEVTAPVAKKGYKFVGWKVEGAENLLTEGVQVHITPELCEFTAVFEEDTKAQRTITITINAGENGTFAGENGSKPIVYEGISETSDEVFTLPEVKANDGYEFAGWLVQGDGEVSWSKEVTTFKATGLAKFLEGSQVGYITITAEYQKASEPSTEKPSEPSTEAPTQPSTEAPTQPSTEVPTQPSTEAPTQPSTDLETEVPDDDDDDVSEETEKSEQKSTDKETEKAAEKSTENSNAVKTGDNTAILPYAVAMLMAAAAVILLAVRRRHVR